MEYLNQQERGAAQDKEEDEDESEESN